MRPIIGSGKTSYGFPVLVEELIFRIAAETGDRSCHGIKVLGCGAKRLVVFQGKMAKSQEADPCLQKSIACLWPKPSGTN